MSLSQTPPPGVPTSTTSIQDAVGGSPEPDALTAFEAAGRAAATEPTPAASQTSPAAPAAQPSVPEEDPVSKAIGQHVKPGARVFDGLDEAEQKVFREMSNEGYDKLYPIYKKYKESGFDPKKLDELNAQLEESRKFRYHEHPRAFELSEDYEKAQQIVNNINVVAKFWEDQLIAYRSKQPISLLTRNAQGQLVPTQPVDPTPAHEAEILRNFQKTQNDLLQGQREIQEMSASYKSQFDNYGKTLEKIHNDIFGKHEGVLKAIAEQQLQKFPAFVRNKPEVKSLAYALAALVAGSEAKSKEATQAAADKATKAAALAAGPTAASIQSGANGQPNVHSDEDYKKFKQTYGIV